MGKISATIVLADRSKLKGADANGRRERNGSQKRPTISIPEHPVYRHVRTVRVETLARVVMTTFAPRSVIADRTFVYGQRRVGNRFSSGIRQ